MLALIPHLVPLFLGGLWAPLLAYRYGYVRVILVSMLLLAGSTALFALASVETHYLWFVLPLATLGLGVIFGATRARRADHEPHAEDAAGPGERAQPSPRWSSARSSARRSRRCSSWAPRPIATASCSRQPATWVRRRRRR